MASSLIKAVVAAAALTGVASALPKPTNANTAMRFIYHNNLNLTDDANHVGAILLSPMKYAQAADACGAINENLFNKRVLQQHRDDFTDELSYLSYSGYADISTNQAYFIGDNQVVIVTEGLNTFKWATVDDYSGQSLPVLCTQSDMHNQASASPPTEQNQIMVRAAGNQYIGYRNQKSFRFAGIKYGQYPERWTYSSLYNVTGAVLNATVPGPQCVQYGSGSEDCLYLNIQTPYIPAQGTKQDLRPVLLWIHGGGFTGGVGSDPGSDGQQLASREDVVVVTFNYRLSTYGFLAVPGTDIKGNYGIGDQITALNWVIKNIARFGGDPKQITINGGSAGAGSVRTLLGSPQAIGKFAGAWAMSNLGGGQDLGLGGNYGTTYSKYDTINQSFASAGQQIFQQAGCTQTTLADQVACLRAYNGTPELSSFGTVARYVVQDGSIVVTPKLEVATLNANVAHIPVVFGITATEGASFVGYNKTCTTEVSCLMSNIGISQYYAEQIVNSGLFPYYDTNNVTADSFNVSSRITTDNTFRCIDQATMYAAAVSGAFTRSYYYQSDRTWLGYNPNNVNQLGPVEPGYPYGDPNLPYYHTHGSDMGLWFGGVQPLRDDDDLYAMQLYMDYFGSYIRTRDPNTPQPLLQLRGYTKTLQSIKKSGAWNPVSAPTGPIMRLDYPAMTAPFVDQPQCEFLNYSISYYLQGGT